MNEQSDSKKDIIREFCRSQGAPTAYSLGRLSTKGQRECIRQWIIKARSFEIAALMPKVAEDLFNERTDKDPLFFDALSVEELEERIDHAKRHARKRLDEQIRYGAICIDEIDSRQPWVEYDRYHDLCDREWQLMVEGKRTGIYAWEFFELPWFQQLWLVLVLAFVGLCGLFGIIGKPAYGPFDRGIAGALILISIFLAGAWLVRFFTRGSRN